MSDTAQERAQSFGARAKQFAHHLGFSSRDIVKSSSPVQECLDWDSICKIKDAKYSREGESGSGEAPATAFGSYLCEIGSYYGATAPKSNKAEEHIYEKKGWKLYIYEDFLKLVCVENMNASYWGALTLCSEQIKEHNPSACLSWAQWAALWSLQLELPWSIYSHAPIRDQLALDFKEGLTALLEAQEFSPDCVQVTWDPFANNFMLISVDFTMDVMGDTSLAFKGRLSGTWQAFQGKRPELGTKRFLTPLMPVSSNTAFSSLQEYLGQLHHAIFISRIHDALESEGLDCQQDCANPVLPLTDTPSIRLFEKAKASYHWVLKVARRTEFSMSHGNIAYLNLTLHSSQGELLQQATESRGLTIKNFREWVVQSISN